MKKLFLAPLLAATLLSAQTKTPKRSCPVEDIPHGAIQPVSGRDSTPYCPREDYELKWFVQESDDYSRVYTTSIWTSNGAVSSVGPAWTGPGATRSYYFKPMCLPKEGANGVAN